MPHLVIVRRGHAGAYETLRTEFEHDAKTGVRVPALGSIDNTPLRGTEPEAGELCLADGRL
jgi:hypothetical protein